MKATATALEGVYLIEPRVFGDERGFFYESFNDEAFRRLTGAQVSFVQDNHSRSARGVLRGLHYQTAPKAQGKLVRVTAGAVWDVVLDIRAGSASYGRWIGEELSAANRRQLWIPAGLAHGFVTLLDGTEFLYKTTDYWSPPHERCIAWNDPTLAIPWPLDGAPSLSPKDERGVSFASLAG
ncbi:MAG: dTDP-4-dehydrorhamnose 3,5-epimerase [Proteobacteria bacterium]|nr:dTDP-4-dehydrorhamnose 3,5-epimerase [Pseudomonadota bacterium]